MNCRKKWMGFLCFCLLTQAAAGPASLPSSARDFVREFYNWYLPIALRDNGPGPAWNVVLQQRPSVFGPQLYQALKRDSEAEAQAKGYIVGLEADPFLDSQDPCKHYEVGKVSQKSHVYFVEIYGVCSGKQNGTPDVVAEVTHRGKLWVFVNFIYPPIHSDLLLMLKDLGFGGGVHSRRSSWIPPTRPNRLAPPLPL